MNRFPAGYLPRKAMAAALERARTFGALVRHPKMRQYWIPLGVPTAAGVPVWRTHERVVQAMIATGQVRVVEMGNARPVRVEPV